LISNNLQKDLPAYPQKKAAVRQLLSLKNKSIISI
jgi:hypothetical protein